MSENVRFRTGAAIAAIAFLTLVPLTAFAQVRVNVPAEPLAQALEDLASQADLNVYYRRAAVAGLEARPLQGDLTTKAAFARLLAGTRLAAVYVDEDTVRVVSKIEARRIRNEKASRAGAAGAAAHSGARTRRKDPAKRNQSTGPQRNAGTGNSGGGKSQKKALQEVVVTGSRLPTTSKYGPQEVRIYDRKRIEDSGQNSVAEFLSTLPSVSVTSPAFNHGFASTVRLRGLPVGTTLVLLNGRRVEGSGSQGGSYFDLNNIPLAAVQKIEVDENGSSAVYGSDAIAGVVNIILKKNFSGFAAHAKYGWAKDVRTVRASVAVGKQWHRGGFSVIGSYGSDGGLLNSARLLSASNDYRRFGGPDNNYPICSPGNVFSVSGAPLPGAPAGSTATYAAVTGSATAGRPGFSQFTYGSLNECSVIAGFSLLPSIHRAAALVQGHFLIAPTVTLFSELLYTHVSEIGRGGYATLFGLPFFQQYTVSASNPYNPFGTTVGVAEQLHDVPVYEAFGTNFFQPLVGAKGTLARRWHWQLSMWQSTDWTDVLLAHQLDNQTAIQDALNSSNPATALNPFVNGPIGPAGVLQGLFANGRQKAMSRERSAEGFIRGPVLRLPAGTARAVIGADYYRSTLYVNDINDGVDPPNTHQEFHRRDYAVFAETRIPVLGRLGKALSHNLLSLTISGRHDQYNDFGGATTGQFGVELRPFQGLVVRGTYADAFKAPSLIQLYSSEVEAPNIIADPVTGKAGLVPVLTGGNPHLRPLDGRSHTIGAVYRSRLMPGLSLAATQWQIVEKNAIQQVNPQLIVDYATSFPGRVVRNGAGALVEVIDTQVNFGSIDVAGVDYQLDYRRRLGRNRVSFGASATEIYHYRQALLPGSPAIEAVSKAEDDGDWAPRWKGTLDLNWSRGALSAFLQGRYTGSYQDYDSSVRIGHFWTLDASFRWRIGEWLRLKGGPGRRTYVQAGGTNLLNVAPQFSNYGFDLVGYDAAQASVVGRSLYVDVGLTL